MRIRILPVLLLLVLTGVFVLINWPAVTAPGALNLGLATVSAPLGMVLLGVIVVLAVMYLGTVVYLQGSALLDGRRLSKELQAQRDLADKSEASRFTELRAHLNTELARLNQH